MPAISWNAVSGELSNPEPREGSQTNPCPSQLRSSKAFWILPLGSALAGSQGVRIPGPEARPLGGGTSVGTGKILASKPAGRRVLPRLLPPVDGQIEQPIAVIHRLDAAHCGPVSLEHIG